MKLLAYFKITPNMRDKNAIRKIRVHYFLLVKTPNIRNSSRQSKREIMESKSNFKAEEEEPEAIVWAQKAWALLSSVRAKSPLVQCITNFVSMDLMANTLLSAGASPAMLHSIEELPDFTPQVHALCVNVGTLSADWLPAMKVAAELAHDSGKPWVLDPVAAGASGFRLKACLELVELKPTVIRGNASEIIALANASVGPTKVIVLCFITKCSINVILYLLIFNFKHSFSVPSFAV